MIVCPGVGTNIDERFVMLSKEAAYRRQSDMPLSTGRSRWFLVDCLSSSWYIEI